MVRDGHQRKRHSLQVCFRFVEVPGASLAASCAALPFAHHWISDPVSGRKTFRTDRRSVGVYVASSDPLHQRELLNLGFCSPTSSCPSGTALLVRQCMCLACCRRISRALCPDLACSLFAPPPQPPLSFRSTLMCVSLVSAGMFVVSSPFVCSVLYVTGLVTGFAGWLSPVCLLIVAGILYLYRQVERAVV